MSIFFFWITFAVKSSFRRRKKTVITLTGISLAIAALIMLGSIMNGVNDAIIENALSYKPGHVVIEGGNLSAADALQRNTEIKNLIAPFSENITLRISSPALLSSENRDKTVSTLLTGIQPEKEKKFSAVISKITEGRIFTGTDGKNEIFLGAAAAAELGAGVNDSIIIAGTDNSIQAEITGLFKTGAEFYDNSASFISLDNSLSFFTRPAVKYESIIFLNSDTDLNQSAEKIRNAVSLIPGERITTWEERISDVSQLVDLNRFAMYIMIALVTAILAFGISNTLLISVMDRYKHFAALKAIGVHHSGIITAVISESFFMCLFAGAIGTITGIAAVLISARTGIDISYYTSKNPNFTMSSVIIPRLTAGMTMLPQLFALLAGVVSSFWPAWNAAMRNPASGMRDI